MDKRTKNLIKKVAYEQDPSTAIFEELQEANDSLDTLNSALGGVDMSKITTLKGEKGDKGDKGDPGYTAVKGKDYFTPEEIKAFAEHVTPKKGVNYNDGKDGKDGAPGKDGIGLPGVPGLPGKDGSPDTAEEIASKLNTLEGAIDATVIKGGLTFESIIKELKGKNKLKMRDIEGMPLNMNDQRWHGGGLSKVYHDDTLTGDGTVEYPLSVVGGGTTPGGPQYAVQFNDPLGTFNGSSLFTYDGSTLQLNTTTATPENEQFSIKANGLGNLGFLNFGPGDQEIHFDTTWTGSDYIANNTTVSQIWATNDGLVFYTDSGQTVGNSVSFGAPKMGIKPTGQLQLNSYGSGSITGTPTYSLSVDASGNIIETTGGSGTDQVKVDVSDTTPGFLTDKIASTGTNISTTVLNPGGNEQLQFNVTAAGIDTQIQYNNGGLFGADGNFTWDTANKLQNTNGSLTVLSNTNINPVSSSSQIVTAPRSIYAQAGFLYVAGATTGNLTILDVSNPTANPLIVSTFTTGATTLNNIYVKNDYAYLLDVSGANLYIVDISDKANPVTVSTTATGTNPYFCTVQDKYLFLVNQVDATLVIYNISNPAIPTVVSTTSTGTNPTSVAVDDRYAYVTNNVDSTLQIFDISNPASPTSLSTIGTGLYPFDVKVSSGYAYITNNGDTTISIIDVNDPATPVVSSSLYISTGGSSPWRSFIAGRYYYAILRGSSQLVVLDVLNKSAPVIAGSIALASDATEVFVVGNYAYTCSENAGVVQPVYVHGIQTNALTVGSLQAGQLQVMNDVVAGNSVTAKFLYGDGSGITNLPSGGGGSSCGSAGWVQYSDGSGGFAANSSFTSDTSGNVTVNTIGGACGSFTDLDGSNVSVGTAATFSQIATPSNPIATTDKLYFKNDDNLYILNSVGVETQVNGGGITIGSPVGGGTANAVLYNDGSVNLADSSNFTYNGTDLTVTGGTITGATVTDGTLNINGGYITNGICATFTGAVIANGFYGSGAFITGLVHTVSGLNTNNTDPENPIVQVSVDGVTITGAGTPGSPLVAVASNPTWALSTPTGSIDGVNAVFTLPHTPLANSLFLFLNGQYQTQGYDFTLSGSTITFGTPPAAEFSGLPFKAQYQY